MPLLPELERQIERIPDRETRHKARSLLACYLGYLDLVREAPEIADRASALQRGLRRIGISAPLPELDEDEALRAS